MEYTYTDFNKQHLYVSQTLHCKMLKTCPYHKYQSQCLVDPIEKTLAFFPEIQALTDSLTHCTCNYVCNSCVKLLNVQTLTSTLLTSLCSIVVYRVIALDTLYL